MDSKVRQLLQYLAGNSLDYRTSRSMAAYLGVSSRTVIRYMRQLEQLAAQNGFVLETKKGKGYRLRITNPSRFDACCHEAAPEQSEEMVAALTAAILTGNGIRIDDLAEHFNYSRSSVSRFVSRIESLLVPFYVRIYSRGLSGLRAEGREMCIRAALFDKMKNVGLEKAAYFLGIEGFTEDIARNAVEELALREGLRPEPENVIQFLCFMLICAARAAGGHTADRELAELSFGLLSSKTAMCARAEKLAALAWMRLPHNGAEEKVYLALAWEQLLAASMPKKQKPGNVPDIFRQIVQKAFEHIQSRYNANFFENASLRENLEMHISQNYGRYLLGLDLPNPYSEAVRSRYPLAYYYTLELAEEITRVTGMPLFSGELGYIALYMAAAMEQGPRNGKVRVAIVCSTAFGTAELLKIKLEQHYADVLDIVGVYSMKEAQASELPVELYISTLITGQARLHGKPLLELSPFLDEGNRTKLNTVISGLADKVPIREFFGRQQFFFMERPAKKRAVLEALFKELIQQRRITPQDAEAVLARESLVSTEIYPHVAMPHCIIQGSSFLSFVVLRHPVFWGQSKVRLVLLGCFQRKDIRIKRLLTQLYCALSDEKRVNALIACRDYAAFFALLDTFIQGEETLC